MPDILIVFATRIPNMILTEASLSYLGFGVQPPTPSWGGMLSSSAITYMYSAPWMVIWPGLFLTLLIFSVNMFADALRDLVDPKLRGNAGASDFRLPGKKLIHRITKGYNIQIRIGKERIHG
jgi:peptide/nickel transport system permease protein